LSSRGLICKSVRLFACNARQISDILIPIEEVVAEPVKRSKVCGETADEFSVEPNFESREALV